jgi:hypothetical protein
MKLTPEGLLSGVAGVEERFRLLLLPLSPEQKNWNPPGVWSAVQCLDHMNVTVETYLPNIREAVARGRNERQVAEGPYRVRFLERRFLKTLEPPVRFRVRAPKAFLPSGGSTWDGVEQRFFDLREELRQAIRSAEGLDLSGVKLSSPAFSWFHIGLGPAFASILAHDRRHFWQIEQLKANPGFPISEAPDDRSLRVSPSKI